MRVAVFTETFLPKIDGIVRVVCLTLDHLARHGIEVLVIAPEQGVREYGPAKVLGVPCIKNPVYPEGRIGFVNPSTYRKVRRFKPDLIHAMHPANIGLAGVLFGRWLRVPVVASFHLDIAHMAGFYGQPLMGAILRRTVKWGFNHSAVALAPSKIVQRKMVAEGIRNVGLWRRGVDAEKFHPRYASAETRAELSGGHPERTILLYTGRLAPEKQIEQVRIVLEQVPNTHLALVGDGPHRAELERHFAGLPVTFVGYRTGEALARCYASADMFVFPSAFESFGLVLLEAMASGLPVVTSQVGGAQDMVIEGQTGHTFPVDDVQGLLSGVQKLLNTPEVLPAARIAARQHAETFAWPVIMDELVACYEAILTGKPSPI